VAFKQLPLQDLMKWHFVTLSFRQRSEKVRFALFCNYTQRRVVNPYRHFGKTYRYYLQGSRSPRSSWPSRSFEDGLSRNICTELPLYAAL